MFVIIFLVGGFFINTTKVNAEESFQLGKASSYTMSSYTNSAGGISTIARVGCDPQSGDKYDINTGKLCSYAISDMLIGCVAGSGDKYDINTGKLCASLSPNIRIGCPLNGIEIYDINTGNHCINNTSILTNPTKTVAKTIPNITTTTKTTITGKASELAVAPNNSIEILPTKDTEKQLSGRQMIGNSLDASVKKVGSIINSPMFIPLILLIIVILLGGGYAVYSLFKKDKKVEVKKIITEPIIQHKPITPVTPPIAPQFKTPNQQGSLLNNSQNPNPNNPQVSPLNIPHNSNPNPQEPF